MFLKITCVDPIGTVRHHNTMMHKKSDWSIYQYPLYEHVIVLLSKLRSAEHKSAQQLYSRLSHTCGVVHQTTMDATLHVGLQNRQDSVSTYTGKNTSR